MLEESFFFVRVDELCKGPAVTCARDLDMVEVARMMRDRNISGVVVADGDRPAGIISDRDCRNLIAEHGGDVRGHTAEQVMRSPVVSVTCDDHVFDVIFQMARHGIHRAAVVDGAGNLLGVITDTDLLSIQTQTPLYLNQEIETADSLDDLKRVNERLLDMVTFATRAGAGTKDLVGLISHFNDAVTLRVIHLLAEQGVHLPAGAAYLVLGSEGREEQTLRTDQDSAMAYRDHLSQAEQTALARFSEQLIEALISIGVPPCPGGTMANNPAWRHSVSEWKRVLEQWITVPTPENMVNFGMVQDFRVLAGDAGIEAELHDHVRATVEQNALFLPYVARNIVRFPPPLGLFGRIRVERQGEHKGTVDLKKAGIFAMTEGISLLALEAGILRGSTWDKLRALGEQEKLPLSTVERLDDAFTLLVGLRLQCQLEAVAAGKPPTNHVNPAALSARERESFRDALHTVGSFLRAIRERYKLDLISR